MNKKLTVNFALGARTVTGSNFLISNGKRTFLVDCGLLQGVKAAEDINREEFPYDTSKVDALFVTHAHMDHVGRIPKLVKDGFKGQIFSTHPTKDLGEVMLEDSLGVLTKEAEHDELPPLYTTDDIKHSMNLWDSVEYHEPVFFDKGTEDEISFVFRDAGHILGSAMVEITYNKKKIVFTGDLGNTPAPLLRDTEMLTDTDYLFMESVYGDRNHEPISVRDENLKRIITESMNRGGTLVIPAFSLERTQDLLFKINNMVEGGLIPRVPIYLDSPLAIKVTDIYKKNSKYFNHDAQSIIHHGDDIFNFPGLVRTASSDESKAINHVQGAKVVIAGSGMMNGGRVVHHARNYLPHPENTLMLVGYQAAGTPGRLIDEGAKYINLFGVETAVRARIEKVMGYSAHKDSDHLVEMVGPLKGTVKQVFVILGELKSSLFLAQRIKDEYGIPVSVPDRGDIVELDCN